MKIATPATLLCFLIILLLAVPAASQAQATATPFPTANATQLAELETRQVFPLINPSAVLPCGLPVRSSGFSSGGSRTFTMTADCVISANQIHTGNFGTTAFMMFTGGGPYTINGNGYSIIGPPNTRLFAIANNVTLNLNNVTIRGAGGTGIPVAEVAQGTLQAMDITFQSNRALSAVAVTLGGVDFRNAKFRDNRFQQAAVTSVNQLNRVFINRAEFVNNVITEAENVLSIQAGDLILEGRIAYRANTDLGGRRANLIAASDIVNYLSTNAEIIEIRLPKKKEEVSTATPTPRPLAVTCPALSQATGIAVSATYGLTSGIQCQQLNGAGIGIQSIIDAGFIDAVDIWGYVDQGVEVCFPQAGRILFLDARTMPRAITPLESTVVNGMTCAPISSPGSLILMPN